MLTEFQEFALRGNVLELAVAPTLNYGLFVKTVVLFLIVAWVVFLVIRPSPR